MERKREYRAVVTGGSAGGVEALVEILEQLPAEFGLPVLAVQHLHRSADDSLALHLDRVCRLHVTEARDKQELQPGHVYVAPADYHLLVERRGSLALDADEKVNYSRPSIDVSFETAARAFGPALIGVLLSGANGDGARGLRLIRALGGLTIAQEPSTASCPVMPRSAIDIGAADRVLAPPDIGRLLVALGTSGYARARKDEIEREPPTWNGRRS